ncbi:hypothetical protein [Iodobacter fluviatilis]|uniref:Uncharacterized protein n=1 Tax=Iodobacter fluviatilis TaxID=537 RepID=A0A377ST28_9NEIS|nr:hypothetical protein [Iodobacter fluviatilis]TCU81336.1 hypothetical protein EV682_12349 [Iodobacter fluviatilis]STR45192.1 Uncharacterised protein [Iodobacter fluviatilis]
MNQQENSFSAEQGKNLLPQSSIDGLAELSIGELLYNFYVATGSILIGSPDVFSVYHKITNQMFVYSDTMSQHCHVRSFYDGLLDTLDVSQGYAANFNVCGKHVVCVLEGVTTQSDSYDLAAVYAVLLHAQQTKDYIIVRNQNRSSDTEHCVPARHLTGWLQSN